MAMLILVISEIGVDRLTIAGSATPRQVYDLIRSLRGVRPPPKAIHNSLQSYQETKPKVLTNNLQAVKCGIECHL
jgi:hypothetical protein